jgi:hypothetical protein
MKPISKPPSRGACLSTQTADHEAAHCTIQARPRAARHRQRAYTVIVGQRLHDRANRLSRQDLIPRSAQLVRQCDGGSALRRIQFAITYKSSEGDTGFERRPPTGDDGPGRAKSRRPSRSLIERSSEARWHCCPRTPSIPVPIAGDSVGGSLSLNAGATYTPE